MKKDKYLKSLHCYVQQESAVTHRADMSAFAEKNNCSILIPALRYFQRIIRRGFFVVFYSNNNVGDV